MAERRGEDASKAHPHWGFHKRSLCVGGAATDGVPTLAGAAPTPTETKNASVDKN